MTDAEVAEHYRRYIACLNERRLEALGEFVHVEVVYNGQTKTRAEYQAMIANDIDAAPDLFFNIDLLVVEADMVACRIAFDCTPRRVFLGLQPNGSKVSFAEHVFYRFREGKIAEVWSLIDKWSVAQQLGR